MGVKKKNLHTQIIGFAFEIIGVGAILYGLWASSLHEIVVFGVIFMVIGFVIVFVPFFSGERGGAFR